MDEMNIAPLTIIIIGVIALCFFIPQLQRAYNLSERAEQYKSPTWLKNSINDTILSGWIYVGLCFSMVIYGVVLLFIINKVEKIN